MPNNGSGKGDPSTAFDAIGNGYIATMTPVTNNFGAEPNGYAVQMTANNGTNWGSQNKGVTNTTFDKEMIVADDLPSSPYANNLYCGWMGPGSFVQFNRSTDHGVTFSNPITLTNYWGQGANVQSGVNGEVYICWADYNGNSLFDFSSKGLGFSKSLDGGVTFSSAQRVLSYVGIRQYNTTTHDEENPLFNGIRVNDFPSMSIDKSTGIHRGRIYVTLPVKQNGNGKAIVQVSYSDNQGSTWTTPITVSISNATQTFFPWVSVDSSTGIVYVIYYAFDQSSGFSTNTYVATSSDGGNTFSNQKVSSVAHTTAPINGFLYGYEGDYIGITSYAMKAYAAWMDNRTNQWQNYVAKIDNTPIISGTPAFCSSTTYTATNLLPNTTVTWSVSPTGIVSLAPSGNQVTVTKISQGFATLTATVNQLPNMAGTLNITTYPAVSAVSSSMSGPCANGYQTWYVSATPNMSAGNWQWTVDNPSSGTYNFQNPNSPSTYVSVKGGGGISVTFKDACGETSAKGGVTIWSPCTGGSAVIIYPNPASNQLTIQNGNITTQAQAAAAGQTAFQPQNYSVELFDATGKVLKSGQSSNGDQNVILATSDLLNGTYYLLIIQQGMDVIEKQVIIQH